MCPIAQNAVCVKRLGWDRLPFPSSHIEENILRSFSKTGLYLMKREASSTWSTAFQLYASSREDREINRIKTAYKPISKYAQVWEGVENWEMCPIDRHQAGKDVENKDSCSLELVVCVSVVPQCLVDQSRDHLWKCQTSKPVVLQRVGNCMQRYYPSSSNKSKSEEGSYLLA